MKLGDWLKRNGVTQEEFADRLDVDQSFISRLVQKPGKRHSRLPSLELAVKIEAATDGAVKPSDFVDPAHGEPSAA